MAENTLVQAQAQSLLHIISIHYLNVAYKPFTFRHIRDLNLLLDLMIDMNAYSWCKVL